MEDWSEPFPLAFRAFAARRRFVVDLQCKRCRLFAKSSKLFPSAEILNPTATNDCIQVSLVVDIAFAN
jgi:hypothetical protein